MKRKGAPSPPPLRSASPAGAPILQLCYPLFAKLTAALPLSENRLHLMGAASSGILHSSNLASRKQPTANYWQMQGTAQHLCLKMKKGCDSIYFIQQLLPSKYHETRLQLHLHPFFFVFFFVFSFLFSWLLLPSLPCSTHSPSSEIPK